MEEPQQQQYDPFGALRSSWHVASRLVVLAISLCAASLCNLIYSHTPTGEALLYIYEPLAFLFFISALSALWLRFFPSNEYFTVAQLWIDLLTISGIIYITGGPVSPFLFLYLPVVMAAAIFLNRKGALLWAGTISLSHALIVIGMTKKWLPLPKTIETLNIQPGEIVLQWIGLTSAAILIGIATSYLRKSLRSSTEAIRISQQHVENLLRQQQTLFEGLPEGVITFNSQGVIQSLNQAACTLLNITKKQGYGLTCEELSELLSSLYEMEGTFTFPEKWQELSLNHPTEKYKRKILHHARQLVDQKDQQIGTLVIIQDVTQLRTAEEQLALQERMARLQIGPEEEDVAPVSIRGFVGESKAMQKLFQLISRVAQSQATVLISGESGTGKELVAQSVHASSARSQAPFIPVNCGAIPETLIESELFGHKKGSFTGAVQDHLGLFRKAHGGTIFLDEIGELPIAMQSKLLRTIQERSVRPVGSDQSIPIDVRIIAATNRNLSKEVQAGNFREDLFYRLNVIQLKIPPLRERKEDIPLLVHTLLQKIRGKISLPTIPPQTMQILMDYHYPGNVRELENLLERASVFGADVILPEHLPEFLADRSQQMKQIGVETEIIFDENLDFPINLDLLLNRIEQHYLTLALEKSNGVKKHAAELLGMNFRSFRYRLQKFDLQNMKDS